MPLSSVLSDLRGLLENAVSILTEPPQQASTEFFSPPSIPTLCLFFSQARFECAPRRLAPRRPVASAISNGGTTPLYYHGLQYFRTRLLEGPVVQESVCVLTPTELMF